MKPLRFICFFLPGLLGAGSLLAAVARPNVLFIVADDLRTNLGCYGDPVAHTPHLDGLAARGVLFERAYAQQTICNPSRSSVMTGKRPGTLRLWNLGTHFRDLVPDVVTLPQLFKQAGYFTRSIGKVNHNFTVKNDDDGPSWSVPAVLHWGSHGKDVAVMPAGVPVPPNLSDVHSTEMRAVPDEAYIDGRVAATAIAALQDLKQKGEPFFLAVGFWKPHRPFNPPKRYWDLYRPEDIPDPVPFTAASNVPALALESQLPDLVKAAAESPEARRTLRWGYYAATSYLDAQVGRVVDELDRLGLGDNTIIVFWSDHGFMLGEHSMWGKTSCFELDARVPLIIVPPGGTHPATRTLALAELLDLYPTIAEMGGLTPPADLDGVSLCPAVADPFAVVQTAAFTEHPRPWAMTPPVSGSEADAMGYSVRDARHRYTEWREWKTGRTLGTEFYDHDTDPIENVNLAADPAAAATIERLRRRLEKQFPRGSLSK